MGMKNWFKALGMDQQGELMIRLQQEVREEKLATDDTENLYLDFLEQSQLALMCAIEDREEEEE